MTKLCKPYICKNAFADDVADGIYDCKIKNYEICLSKKPDRLFERFYE